MQLNVQTSIFVVFFLLLFNSLVAQVEIEVKENENKAEISLAEPTNSSKQDDGSLKDKLAYDSDEQIHEAENQKTYLLRNAVIDYTDMHLEADYVEISWDTGDVYAEGIKDSLGVYTQPTVFKQGNQVFEQNAFKFNFNTQKGTAYQVRFANPEDDGVAFVEEVYRVNDSTSYGQIFKYTTDTYYKEKKTNNPDYYIQAEEAKILDREGENTVIARYVELFIHDVPTPLALPFIYLPTSSKRKAGVLIPTFGEREELGFFLNGTGLYLPLGEYLDLTLTTDFYSRGSWGVHAESVYKKRYRFNGKINFDFENQLQGTKGLDNFSRNRLMRITWNHSQDSKANPNLVFSASVNYASNQYFRNSINNNNVFNQDFLTNNIASTISLNKRFDNSPFTASLTASLNQLNNSNTTEPASINLRLPQLAVNMSRVYPFAPKSGSKKGLAQNLAVDYSFNFRNDIETNEDDLFSSRMFDNAELGAQHRFNFNTGITVAKYFPLNFTASYNEVWYIESFQPRYDPILDAEVTDTISGFSAFRTFNTSVNTQTNIYGIFTSKKEDALIKGIRHVINPVIGFSFTPDFASEFWGYYDTYRRADGRQTLFTRFRGIYGSPSSGLNTNLTFALNNNLEMKVRDKTDSTGYKKIKIFDYLNFRTSYNFAADSLKLAPINMTGATKFFDGKLALNYNATFEPYRLVFEEGATTGRFVDQLRFPSISSYSLRTGYNFSNDSFGGGLEPSNYSRRGAVRQEDFYFDEDNYAKFSIPWNINLGLNYSFNRGTAKEATTFLSANVSAGISPTPHWSLRTTVNYDFINKDFSATNINFDRDLRSFALNFSWQPFGEFRSWRFGIRIKSSVLSDVLKYDDNSSNELRGNGSF